MRGTTHLAAGIAATAFIASPSVATAAGIILGSVLPDIDKKTSLIGRYVPIIPNLLPHRTITHSALLIIALLFICPPLAIGCAIHILLDMCTAEGVPLLWPRKKKYKMPIIARMTRSGGWFDKALGSGLWLFNFAFYGCVILQVRFPMSLPQIAL